MSEKKGEMPNSGKSNAKKANLLDHNSIKHLLDESASEVNDISIYTGGN